MKTRLQLFSLSFFLTLSLSRYRSLPRSLSPFLHWSFIVKFALGYGFLSLARRFSLDIFFFRRYLVVVVIVSLHCVVSRSLPLSLSLSLSLFSSFFPIGAGEIDTRGAARRALGRTTILRTRVLSPDASLRTLPSASSSNFLGSANATRRDSKARKLCQPL